MVRTFATTTAVAAALIALSPMQTVAQVNVPPQQPKVNVAPNVPNVPTPRVNRPNVTPEPDTSRVRLPDEEEEDAPTQSTGTADAPEPEALGHSAPQTAADRQDDGSSSEALANYAPIPPLFPETLAKAAPRPPEKPERVALIDPDGASDDDSGNLGDAAGLEEDQAPGLGGDEMQIGQGAADRLRARFHAGLALELERAEQLARLREIRGLGGLEVGLDDASPDRDCGPGVNMPAGTDLQGVGCDGAPDARPDEGPGGGPHIGAGPTDPRFDGYRHPKPSPDDGLGGNREHENAWIGEGGGSSSRSGGASATDNAGIKNFSREHAQQGGNGGAAAGANAGSNGGSGDDDRAPEMIFDEKGRVIYDEFPDKDGEGYTSETTFYFDDGSKVTFFNKHDNQDDAMGTSQGYTFYPPRRSGEKPRHFPAGSGGGEAEQPDPRGPRTGGSAGADCLMLGIRCDVAETESGETWGEKMQEWARQIGSGHDMLTPKEAMEQAGQPVPTEPWRESSTDKVDDPRSEAGLTPGCDADPGGCGGGAGGSEAAGAAADDALDDAAIDTSIAGVTPGCDADPGGCGGAGDAAAEAAVESGAGEEAR